MRWGQVSVATVTGGTFSQEYATLEQKSLHLKSMALFRSRNRLESMLWVADSAGYFLGAWTLSFLCPEGQVG